jgi:hypothetical protein
MGNSYCPIILLQNLSEIWHQGNNEYHNFDAHVMVIDVFHGSVSFRALIGDFPFKVHLNSMPCPPGNKSFLLL